MKTVIGTPYFTPSMMDAEISDINTGIMMLKADVETSSVEEGFKLAFDSFVKGWESYKDSLGVLAKTLNSTWDKVQEYKAGLNEWRRRFIKKGGKTYVLDTTPKQSFLQKVPWWAWLTGAGAVWYFFRGEPKRSHHKSSE